MGPGQAAKRQAEKDEKERKRKAEKDAIEAANGAGGTPDGDDAKKKQRRIRSTEVTSEDLPIIQSIPAFPVHRRVAVCAGDQADVDDHFSCGRPFIVHGKEGFHEIEPGALAQTGTGTGTGSLQSGSCVM